MRSLLFSLAVVGSVAAGGTAIAAPAPLAPALDRPAGVHTVQYYAPDWRAREAWRHRRHEEWRRREAWRRHHLRRERHGGEPRPRVYARPGS